MLTNDYIKRSDAINALNVTAMLRNLDSVEDGPAHRYKRAAERIIAGVPAADVEPLRHGRWVEVDDDYAYAENVYRCSECGEEWDILEGTPLQNMYYYCPHCGARMDAEPPKEAGTDA